jgi:catechol-2,3-dioxygenase
MSLKKMTIKKLSLQTAYLKTLQEFYSSILELSVQSLDEKKINIKIGNSALNFSESKNGEPVFFVVVPR